LEELPDFSVKRLHYFVSYFCCCCDQIADRNNLNKGGHVFPPSFRGLSLSWLALVSGSMVSIMALGTCGRGCLPHGGQEAKSKNRKGPGQDTATKDTPSVTYFLQLGPIAYPSPPPSKPSIKGFIIGLSPHDLIISGNTITDTHLLAS
jgi:hypothetical protein